MKTSDVYLFKTTPQQRRLWVLDRIHPGTAAYNVPLCLHLRGSLDVDALEESLATLVSNHEILRTTFGEMDGAIVQLVHESMPFALERIDASELDERALDDLLQAASRIPFDLVKGPLVRASLYRRKQDEHILLFRLHHIVCDGWSLGILARDLMATYNALKSGSGALPEPPEHQYADYAEWLDETLESEQSREHLAYWRKALEGLPPALELPRLGAAGKGAVVQLPMSRQLGDRINAFARQLDASPFMVLVAAFGSLLVHYRAGEDLAIGTPVANRDQNEVANTIGFFINTLVLRLDGSGNPSLRTATAQARRVCLDAFAHQELPFDVLVNELRPERAHDGRAPLFQAMLALQNTPLEPLKLSGLEAIPRPVNTGEIKNDLTLIIDQRLGEQWLTTLEYDYSLLTPDMATAFLKQYVRLLELALAQPDVPLGQLRILDDAERSRQTAGVNPRDVVQTERTLVEWFEAQVQKTPDACAAVCENVSLTYNEINARANRLARRLREHGIASDALVGLCLDRTMDLVIGILAILKAGAAYVPLDPRYPQERLTLLADDSRAALILTKSDVATSLPQGKPCLYLDEPAEVEAIARLADTNLGVLIQPENGAYVIYTSGSTGKPKGCVVEHRNVTALMEASERHFEFGENDAWTFFHSYAFDFSVWELWGAWLYGGRVVIVPYWISRSPADFAQLIQRERVTVLSQTPSAFRQAMTELIGKPHVLRYVVFGGEALQLQSLAPWYLQHPDDKPRLVNMYGITETTVHVTYCALKEQDAEGLAGSTIGAPLPFWRIYLLNNDLEPVPQGAVGEIYVGGAGITRGYLGLPALTATRFVPDPFSDKPGTRLYRSGDLARRTSDGSLEYIGRADHQIKVRGFRIEPAEIQAALCTHPAIAEALALVQDNATGEKRLVGYVAVPQGDAPSADELRAWLSTRLPDHMIPQAFVALHAFPLTEHGKINRNALPRPEEQVIRKQAIAPRNDTETRLAAIWQHVLGLSDISVSDNFFAVGGDSILALQVASKARADGLFVSPRQVFEHQTIAELARVVGTTTTVAAQSLEATGLTPIQQWFFDQSLAQPNHWNQSIVLALDTPLDPGALTKALAALAERHDALRMRFRRVDSEWVQEPANKGPHFPLTITTTENLEQAAAAVQSTLDIARGPVAAATLVKGLPGQSDHLVLALHHLVVDGVSWRILADDLQALLFGKESTLRPPPTSYVSWAARLRKEALLERTHSELSYWTNVFRNGTTALPRDGAGENLEAGAETMTEFASAGLTEMLLRHAPTAQQATVQEILLAALAAVFEVECPSPLVIALESQGREELDPDLNLSATVGWFTSLFPFSLPHRQGRGARAVRMAKERLRAVPRNGIGYGLLRYVHTDDTIRISLAEMASMELAFNYLGQVRGGKDGTIQLMTELRVPERAAENRRAFAIDLNAMIIENRLRVAWTYHPALHHADTIHRWAKRFLVELDALVHACINEPRIPSPADYPLAVLDDRALELILARYSQAEDICPLSPMQQGMLYHAIDGAEQGLYVEQISGLIQGSLDMKAFADAWSDVLARHRILRSAIDWQSGPQAYRIVAPQATMPVEELDWRELNAPEQEKRFAQLLAEDRVRGLQLEQAPLMRATVLRLRDHTWRWIWTHHHIILDGWSLPIVFGEVMHCYEARVIGHPPTLSTGADYKSYLRWLAQKGDDGAAKVWRDELAGLVVPQRIEGGRRTDTRHTRPDTPGGVEIVFTDAQKRDLETFVRAQGLTASTLLLGAWMLILSQHGVGRRPVVGVTVAGRPADLHESGQMVGLFINTLPIAHDVAPEALLGDWLRALQQRQVHLREWEHCRLPDIRRWADLESDGPLFESLFVFENYPISESLRRAAAGISIEEIQFIERTNYPLTVALVPGQQVLLKIDYDGDRFDRQSADALLHRLHEMVLRIVHADGSSARIGTFSALTAAEENKALGADAAWPGSVIEPELAHAAFERNARTTPDAWAIDDGRTRLSYADLERKANQMAHRLRAHGAGNETIVGLLLNQSIELVLAILAVLKAGSAWLPLNPEYPDARLVTQLSDTRARILISRGAPPIALAQQVAATIDITALMTRDDTPDTAPESSVSPDHLAYVIYTSGSTGGAKGVWVPHAGVANQAYHHAMVQQVKPTSRVYQFASPSFDAFVAEMFTTLNSGATLCVPSEAALSSRDPLAGIRAGRITHLTIPPSLANIATPSDFPMLECLTLAGEAGTGALFRRFAEHCRVVNAYGPTESTVCASLEDCTNLEDEPVLGRAMPGKTMYLLDAWGRLVPPGLPGEIAIGGLGAARGYHGRPGLTAAAFVPDPFSPQPGARLYRTGDLGVRLPDGRIRFAGRIDRQIKLRGFRIEPGEIEAVLCAYPAVRHAIVQLHRPASGSSQLIAYVEMDDTPWSETAIDAFLAERLPTHARPSRIVRITQWPRLSNGKVDFQALVPPAEPLPSATSNGARSDVEKLLIDIWSHVLGHPAGLHDNFYALGGDSISSLQIVARAREAGMALTPRLVVEHPTIAALAMHVVFTKMAHMEPEPRVASVPLSPIQRWYFGRNLVAQERWNLPIAFVSRVPMDATALLRALRATAARHDVFRIRFALGAQGWQALYAPNSAPSLRVFDFTDLDESTARHRVEEFADEMQGSFDLAQGPLLAAALFQLPSGQHEALIVAHHLVIDAVSWRYVLADLMRAYAGNELPPMQGLAFRKWTTRLETAAREGFFADEIPFWQNVLQASITPLPMRPQSSSEASAQCKEIVTEIERTNHPEMFREGGAHTRNQLLAGIVRALHQAFGARNVCIDIESHGRTSPWDDVDIHATVGWFTTLYPVRLDVVLDDARGQVAAVANAFSSIPREGLGFGVLSQLAPQSNQEPPLAHAPPRQIAFNYLGDLDNTSELPDSIALLDKAPGRAFDERQAPAHALAIDCFVVADTLRIRWRFDTTRLDEPIVTRLTEVTRRSFLDILSQPKIFHKIDLADDGLSDILAELAE